MKGGREKNRKGREGREKRPAVPMPLEHRTNLVVDLKAFRHRVLVQPPFHARVDQICDAGKALLQEIHQFIQDVIRGID